MANPGANKDAAAAVDTRMLTNKRAPELKNAQSTKVVEKDRAVGGSLSRAKRTLPAGGAPGKSQVTVKGTGSSPKQSQGEKRTRSALGTTSLESQEPADQVAVTSNSVDRQQDSSHANKKKQQSQPASSNLVDQVMQALNSV